MITARGGLAQQKAMPVIGVLGLGSRDTGASFLKAGRVKGVRLHVLNANNESEIDAAFATLVQLHARAVVLGTDPLFYSRIEQLAALAARHAVPAISQWREFAEAGGLISYGSNLA